MTPAELLAIPPKEILAMTDGELAAKLLPLFPAARTPYTGVKASASETVMMPGGQKKSVKQLNQENALIAQALKKLGL